MPWVLIQWAEAFGVSGKEKTNPEKQKAVDMLYEKLPKSKKANHTDYPRDKILKKVVFACPAKVSASISDPIEGVLDAYKTVKTVVDSVRKYSDTTQARRLRRNLLFILRYKYDDIDLSPEDNPTIRQLGNSIHFQLEKAAELNTSEKIADALAQNFYGEDTDPALWMYQQTPDQTSPVGKAIANMDPQSAQILCDKGFHGYDLLFFALREQYAKALEKDFRQTLHTETGDTFLDMLYENAARAIDQGHSAAYVSNQVLPALCRRQLETLLENKDPNVLIPLVYKQVTEATANAFWKMFSWEEIEAYLRTVNPHAQ